MMSRKLIASILIVSFALLELLAVRQEQLNTVHEMAQLHHAIDDGNEKIIVLSIGIEMECSPSHIQESFVSAEHIYENIDSSSIRIKNISITVAVGIALLMGGGLYKVIVLKVSPQLEIGEPSCFGE